MSKTSQSVDQKPDDFEDDFDYEGNTSQPYAGQRVSGNNLMNSRHANGGHGDNGEYPMVVLPNNRRYGTPAQNNYRNNNESTAPQEEEHDDRELLQRKRRTYRAVKIFSFILLVFALLGFFVPAYIDFSSDSLLVTGESVVGATAGSPFTVFLNSLSGFPDALLATEALYAWCQFFCVVAILICTIATLVTKRACVVWFCFECIFAVAAVFGYFAFIAPTTLVVVDFFLVGALIAVIAFVVQAFAIGRRGAVIPMISLIAMIAVMVYTLNDELFSVPSSIDTFSAILLKGDALPDLYLFLADIAAALLLVNIVLTVLQLCTFRHTTWFSFVRYILMAVVAIVALVFALIFSGKAITDLLGLLIFVVVAVLLVILSLIACLHNHRVRHPKVETVEPEVEEAPAEEEVQHVQEPQVVAPVVAQTPYAPVPGASNVFININPQGGNAFTTPVPVMQFATDAYTTKKIYSNGFVGTVNRVPHDVDEYTGIRKDEFTAPFDYMGESCANEKSDLQDLLPDRTAPVLSPAELESVMANSSLDTVLPLPEPEEKGESNIEYIAEAGTPSAEPEEEGVEEISAEAPVEEEPVEETEPAEAPVEEVEPAEAPAEETEPAEEEPAEEAEVEEAPVEEPVEEPVEATIEKIEEPVPEEIIDEDEEEAPVEEPAEEAQEEDEEEEEIEDDAFLQSLSKKERKEFRATFLGENDFDYLPAYDIGGDNSMFFNCIFIYLSKIRDSISDDLLAAMYNYLNA